MEFYMPTHIYSETDCISHHGDIFQNYGHKAMIVTGKHSSKVNGSLSAVTEQLEKYEIEYILYDEVEENPSIEIVMKARAIAVSNNVEFIIGIGGGSPMDAAKAIALMSANPKADEDVLFIREKLPYLPVIEVPTTAGTGSEVTPWSILTIHAKRTKSSISHSIHPAVALIDTTYLKTVPRHSLIETAVDTLAHLTESFLVTKATDYSRIFCEKGLQLWGSFKEHLLEDTMTDADYEHMMQACTLGGIAITHTSTGFPHALSYKITYELGTPHGAACGYTLGGFVRYYANQDLTGRVLDALGFENTDAFQDYLDKLIGIPEISEELWQADVDALLKNTAKMGTYPYEIDAETIRKYLRKK
jgi:alcohol dehydrogenase class IV